jgi:ornithine decarboxylase
MMTLDSAEELDKIGQFGQNRPKAKVELIMRLSVDDSQSVCRFSTKFGLCRDNLEEFLDQYIRIRQIYPHLILSGISFHVGSNCKSASSYENALTEAVYCRQLASHRGINLDLLDIGGGLPPSGGLSTGGDSEAIGPREISHLFRRNVLPFNRLIAEPGRYMVSNVVDLYVPVIGCNHTRRRYYINDSVYGSFSCLMYDYAKLKYTVYRRHNNGHYVALPTVSSDTRASSTPSTLSTVFGASCDSLDVILRDQLLPQLCVGDYLCFHHMGAYTYSSSSEFNGLPKPLIYRG